VAGLVGGGMVVMMRSGLFMGSSSLYGLGLGREGLRSFPSNSRRADEPIGKKSRCPRRRGFPCETAFSLPPFSPVGQRLSKPSGELCVLCMLHSKLSRIVRLVLEQVGVEC